MKTFLGREKADSFFPIEAASPPPLSIFTSFAPITAFQASITANIEPKYRTTVIDNDSVLSTSVLHLSPASPQQQPGKLAPNDPRNIVSANNNSSVETNLPSATGAALLASVVNQSQSQSGVIQSRQQQKQQQRPKQFGDFLAELVANSTAAANNANDVRKAADTGSNRTSDWIIANIAALGDQCNQSTNISNNSAVAVSAQPSSFALQNLKNERAAADSVQQFLLNQSSNALRPSATTQLLSILVNQQQQSPQAAAHQHNLFSPNPTNNSQTAPAGVPNTALSSTINSFSNILGIKASPTSLEHSLPPSQFCFLPLGGSVNQKSGGAAVNSSAAGDETQFGGSSTSSSGGDGSDLNGVGNCQQQSANGGETSAFKLVASSLPQLPSLIAAQRQQMFEQKLLQELTTAATNPSASMEMATARQANPAIQQQQQSLNSFSLSPLTLPELMNGIPAALLNQLGPPQHTPQQINSHPSSQQQQQSKPIPVSYPIRPSD